MSHDTNAFGVGVHRSTVVDLTARRRLIVSPCRRHGYRNIVEQQHNIWMNDPEMVTVILNQLSTNA